jgi:O-antigen/teichoic acid export membrane protein
MTLGISFITCLAMSIFLWLGSGPILAFFGHNYAVEASWSLRILALGSLPRIIKDHYVAICRIGNNVRSAVGPMIIGSVMELLFAALGAHLAGLLGLSLGWLFALCVEALFGITTVYKTVSLRTYTHIKSASVNTTIE